MPKKAAAKRACTVCQAAYARAAFSAKQWNARDGLARTCIGCQTARAHNTPEARARAQTLIESARALFAALNARKAGAPLDAAATTALRQFDQGSETELVVAEMADFFGDFGADATADSLVPIMVMSVCERVPGWCFGLSRTTYASLAEEINSAREFLVRAYSWARANALAACSSVFFAEGTDAIVVRVHLGVEWLCDVTLPLATSLADVAALVLLGVLPRMGRECAVETLTRWARAGALPALWLPHADSWPSGAPRLVAVRQTESLAHVLASERARTGIGLLGAKPGADVDPHGLDTSSCDQGVPGARRALRVFVPAQFAHTDERWLGVAERASIGELHVLPAEALQPPIGF